MRKLILLSALSLFLFACSSDDDAPAVDPLLGTWRMTSYEVENEYDFNGDGTASREIISESNCYQNETILINEGGTATVFTNSFLTVVANLVPGTTDEFTYTLDCENDSDIFTLLWSKNGSTLTFIDDDQSNITATMISENQFSFTVSGGFEIYSGGFNVVSEEDVTITYTKQ
ncbi:hypothetical protein [uncultured Kordia sp.]|uniref:hypothetical protein n=1 Tax=uncultured Kordia sp. TaxID=507699 RepID=UPI00262A5B2C|nr:hypothetical protein [uncultured Kordia sp.]